MNDVATLTAQPRALTVDGETYLVHPLTIEEFGQLQGWVDAQFPDPMELAQRAIEGGNYTVAQQQYLMKVAMEMAAKGKRLLGTPDADEKVYSIDGTKEILYFSIRKGRPEFTRADAAALYAKLRVADIERVYSHTNVDMVAADPKAGPGNGTPTPSPEKASTGG
jgi:hypothetical protein